MQDHIRGVKQFIKLDIIDIYYQLQITKEEEWKTVFQTKYGYFKYTVILFRLTNTPASFQRFINEVLREHLNIFIIAYLDNILIFSREYNKYIEHVKKVLKKIENTKL